MSKDQLSRGQILLEQRAAVWRAAVLPCPSGGVPMKSKFVENSDKAEFTTQTT
jgi:hypothetical protein